MSKCTRIHRKKRKLCIGDLKDEIILQNRAITAPVFGSSDFDETFTNIVTVWALINTVSGKTFFDGVNTDINITHEIYIVYDATVTAETWVELKSRRIDILRVENLEERDEYLKLICTDRGLNTINATKT